DRLVIALPAELATTVGGAVDHAGGVQRAVAEHIDHQRHPFACRIFEARPDAPARAEVAHLAARARAVVVVIAAHGDGAGGRIAADHHLHDRGGLAELAVALVFGPAKDA